MGRPLRVERADTLYHVLSRGNEKRAIFYTDRDRQRFLEIVGEMAERFDVEVWAYVLMENHYHLVLKTLQPNLSRAIQWLGVSYVSWFNAKHQRSGHLFQGRFKAFIVQDEDYLGQLLLYVHRNPLRAGLVERLVDYSWSSYECLAYGRHCVKWLARKRTTTLFGGRREFREAVQQYSEEDGKLLENLLHGFFLGSADGLAELLESVFDGEVHREKPQTRVLRPTRDEAAIADVVEKLATRLGISTDDLTSLRRPRRRASRPMRDVLIYLAWQSGAFRLAEIGEHFGVGYTTVTNARKRGESYAREDASLRTLLDDAK